MEAQDVLSVQKMAELNEFGLAITQKVLQLAGQAATAYKDSQNPWFQEIGLSMLTMNKDVLKLLKGLDAVTNAVAELQNQKKQTVQEIQAVTEALVEMTAAEVKANEVELATIAEEADTLVKAIPE
jgi:seryl-tRNA synthetase